MKNVLLVTAGIFHPTLFGRLALHRALNRLEGFSFAHVPSLEKLPADPSSFSALVLHYHHKTISDGALERLGAFVSHGGGILALHAATASFRGASAYFEMLGGRFIGHGAVEKFKIKRVREDVFGDVDNFVVRDELYVHELQPGIEVHFAARQEGQEVPVVWTYSFGRGKVCYAVPGHTTGTLRNRNYQRVLQRGLQWVTE